MVSVVNFFFHTYVRFRVFQKFVTGETLIFESLRDLLNEIELKIFKKWKWRTGTRVQIDLNGNHEVLLLLKKGVKILETCSSKTSGDLNKLTVALKDPSLWVNSIIFVFQYK